MAGVYMVIALSYGVIFFGERARCVYRLHLIASPSPSRGSGSVKGRMLCFQTCANGRLQGHVVPLRHCKIMRAAKDRTLVSLEAKGMRGVFRLGTAGAKIDGKGVPPSQVFDELARRGLLGQRLEMKKRGS